MRTRLHTVSLTICLGLLNGCIHFKETRDSAAELKERREVQERKAADRREDRDRQEKEWAFAYEEKKRAASEERERVAIEKRRQFEEDCASTREHRVEVFSAYLKRREHIFDLRDWESEHCKWVDASKAVVRQVQDNRGEYHLVEGRDRGIDRICDAPLPPELRNHTARDMTVMRPSYKEDWTRCREVDIKASEEAAEFWGE